MAGLVSYGSDSENDSDEIDEGDICTIQPSSSSIANQHVKIAETKPKSFSLLANAMSDEDDSEESLEDTSEVNDDAPLSVETSIESKLSSLLPKPKHHIHGVQTEEDLQETDDIPPKKDYGDEEGTPKPVNTMRNITTVKSAKGTVQITIPSLKNFQIEDEEFERRPVFQGSKKGSGLFALLPQPKNDVIFRNPIVNGVPISNVTSSSTNTSKTLSFVPNSVKQAKAVKIPVKRSSEMKERLSQVRAKYMKVGEDGRIPSKDITTEEAKDDSDDEEDMETDFFSLEKTTLPTTSVPSKSQLPEVEHPDVNEAEVDMNDVVLGPLPASAYGDEVSVSSEVDLMSYVHQAEKKRNSGTKTEVNFIDVNADDLRPTTSDWLKTITDTSLIPPRKAVLPGGLSKRKHQITYLAAEAKAREEELQNQWASNRHNRRITQNKYGF